MGMKFFGSSSGRMDIPAKGDPDPKVFNVEFSTVVGRFTIAVVLYPGCTTFEGRKLLVFRGDQRESLANARKLDPHFTGDALSPVCRFRPDDMALARIFCEAASK